MQLAHRMYAVRTRGLNWTRQYKDLQSYDGMTDDRKFIPKRNELATPSGYFFIAHNQFFCKEDGNGISHYPIRNKSNFSLTQERVCLSVTSNYECHDEILFLNLVLI
jgi:hypothetical protein